MKGLSPRTAAKKINTVYITRLFIFLTILLYTTSSFAQITLVGNTTQSAGGGGTYAVNRPQGMLVGDIMIANLMQAGNHNSDLTDMGATGWTFIAGSNINNGNNRRRGTLLYKVVTEQDITAPEFSFTMHAAAQASVGSITVFRGVDVTGGITPAGAFGGPFDTPPGAVFDNTGSNDNSLNANSITTVTPNAVIIMAGITSQPYQMTNWAISNGGALTLTETVISNVGGGISNALAWTTKITAGATGGGTATIAGNALNGAVLIALRPLVSPKVFYESGLFTVPQGVTCAEVELWGAGGVALAQKPGGGGGGGAYTRGMISDLVPGSTVQVTVGQPTSVDVVGAIGMTDVKISSVGSLNANGGRNTISRSGGAGGTAVAVAWPVTASYAGGRGGNASGTINGLGNEGGGGGGGSATATGAGTNGGDASGNTGGNGGSGQGAGGNGGPGSGGPSGNGNVPGGGGGGGGENWNSFSGSAAAGMVIIKWGSGVACCKSPDVPVITVTENSGTANDGIVCAGANVTLKVTGNLYSATEWRWYSGHCGGTPVGTGTSITVTPGTTTQYFVRGEGGCIENGDCASVTIDVIPMSTITLVSAPGTNAQTLCINTPITEIKYNISNTTGATVSGLPAGVTGLYNAGVLTINGTPAVSGNFTYTITPVDCGTASGTIIVNPAATITLTSSGTTTNQTLCINSPITEIKYRIDYATGASVTGLPQGVSGSYSNGIVNINGTPTQLGVFNYIVTGTGCESPAAAQTMQRKYNGIIMATW